MAEPVRRNWPRAAFSIDRTFDGQQEALPGALELVDHRGSRDRLYEPYRICQRSEGGSSKANREAPGTASRSLAVHDPEPLVEEPRQLGEANAQVGCTAVTAREYTASNLALQSELSRVTEQFSDDGIDVIVLKGIPLARRLYGRIDGRAITDNDLLVRRADVASAVDALSGLGYEAVSEASLDAHLRNSWQLTMRHMLPGSHPVLCDLHWAPIPPEVHPVREELWWHRTERFQRGELDVLVFDPALTILHLASHYEQHLFSGRRIIGDFSRAWDLWQPVDLVEVADEVRMLPTVDYAFRVATNAGLLESTPPSIRSLRAGLLARLVPGVRRPRPRPDLVGHALSLCFAPPRQLLPAVKASATQAAVSRRPLRRQMSV